MRPVLGSSPAQVARQFCVARRPQDVETGGQARYVPAKLSAGSDAIRVIEQVRERPLGAAAVRRQSRERPEVWIGIDGDRSQLRVACQQVPHDENAQRLADATFRTDERDGVRPRDGWLRADAPLDFRFLALAL
jgi:hypothetical protein